MTTIKDIAKVAGVSIATVSRVINNGPKVGAETRAKVTKVMQELGFTPNANARALVTQKSSTIGVVVPELTDPFFASLADGVNKIARQENMQLLLSTCMLSAESEREAITLLIERQCQSIVVHSKMLSDEELITLCDKVPGLVLIDRKIDAIPHKCIWIDNYEGGQIAARHLLALNHQQVACITSNYAIDDPKKRTDGFKFGLEQHNITLHDKLLEFAEPNLQGGVIATQHLLSTGLPFSAIFVYNDAMAIGAISTLEDNGFHVPNDISVIGFDDVLLSSYSRPKLTTLRYPIEKMAQKATQLSLDLLKKEFIAKTEGYKYIPLLVKRESTREK